MTGEQPQLPSLDASSSQPDTDRVVTYFEGSDAVGKDTLADLLLVRNRLRKPHPLKAAGFLAPSSQQYFDDWRCQIGDMDVESGILLVATVRDLGIFQTPNRPDLAFVQASHHAIRGASFQYAFDLQLQDLFEETTTMLPEEVYPIALATSIPELRRRIDRNPASTDFDRIIFQKPEKIEAIGRYIEARCRLLGGCVLETTARSPQELVEEVEDLRGTLTLPIRPVDPEVVLGTGKAILEALRRKTFYSRLGILVDKVLKEFDGA